MTNKKSSEDKKKSYRNFETDFLTLLEGGVRTAGRVTKREFDRVSDNIKLRLEGKYGKEKVDEFTNRIKADWQDVLRNVNTARTRVDQNEALRRGKEIGVQVLEGLASALKRAAESLESSLTDKVTFHAGQMVDRGVYVCIGCSKIQEIKRKKKLAICQECGTSQFRSA